MRFTFLLKWVFLVNYNTNLHLRLFIFLFYCCLAKSHAQTPTLTIPFGHKSISDINILAFSNDDVFMASAAVGDEAPIIWSIKHKCMLYRLEGHKGPIKELIFCKNGKYLRSYSQDNTIKLWDIYLGKCLETIPIKNAQLTKLAISDNGKYIVTQTEGINIEVYPILSSSAAYKADFDYYLWFRTLVNSEF
jgi:WD40 repeat protein